MKQTDALVPANALLPLCDTPGGGYRPSEHTPGRLRPFVATLAVVPIECGKHETTATRWVEDDATEKSDDGKVVPDTVKITRTDS